MKKKGERAGGGGGDSVGDGKRKEVKDNSDRGCAQLSFSQVAEYHWGFYNIRIAQKDPFFVLIKVISH